MRRPRMRSWMRAQSGVAALKDWLRHRGLFYFRRARVVCRNTPDRPGPRTGSEFEIHEASADDVRDLAAAQGGEASEGLARRARGNLCLVARSGSTVLGYVWISRSSEFMAEVDHVLDVSRDPAGVYLYDGYVFAPYRRRGVLRALLNAAMGWARDQEASRLYAAFARENHASELALTQAGFVTVVGDVSFLRVLGHEWKRVRIPRGSPRPDVLNAAARPQPHPAPT